MQQPKKGVLLTSCLGVGCCSSPSALQRRDLLVEITLGCRLKALKRLTPVVVVMAITGPWVKGPVASAIVPAGILTVHIFTEGAVGDFYLNNGLARC